jgi:hypothetical protein
MAESDVLINATEAKATTWLVFCSMSNPLIEGFSCAWIPENEKIVMEKSMNFVAVDD